MSSANSANSPKMDLTPVTKKQAAELVVRLLAGFPYLSLPEPEAYANALGDAFSSYPMWAGEFAIRHGDLGDPSFPPTDRKLRQCLEELVRPHRYAQQWDKAAMKQIAARDDDRPRKTYEEIAAEFAEIGIVFGRGPRDAEGAVDVNALCDDHGVSKEQWDAIPNQADYLKPLKMKGLV